MKDVAREVNNYLNQYIQLLDMKATAIAAAALVVVGLGLSEQASAAEPILKVVGIAFSGIAAIFAGAVMFPRTPHSGNGHIFWADIRSFDTAESYWKSLSSLSEDDLGREYARQNFVVSSVLLKKERMVCRAVWWFAASCVIFALAVAVGTS